jgi:glycosyltransferase involved in cell wall biosynthesis
MISIVIPTLNEEKQLGRCLESLLASAYPQDDAEIIVADSSSTDDTVAIAESYGAQVFQVPKFKLAARDVATRQYAQGNIIVATDADTFWPSNSLSRLVAPLLQKEEVVCTSSPRVYESPVILRLLTGLRQVWHVEMMFGSNSAYKKDAYVAVGGLNIEGIKNHLDADEVQPEEEKYFLERLETVGQYIYVKNAPVFTSSRRTLDGKYRREIGVTRFDEDMYS